MFWISKKKKQEAELWEKEKEASKIMRDCEPRGCGFCHECEKYFDRLADYERRDNKGSL